MVLLFSRTPDSAMPWVPRQVLVSDDVEPIDAIISPLWSCHTSQVWTYFDIYSSARVSLPGWPVTPRHVTSIKRFLTYRARKCQSSDHHHFCVTVAEPVQDNPLHWFFGFPPFPSISVCLSPLSLPTTSVYHSFVNLVQGFFLSSLDPNGRTINVCGNVTVPQEFWYYLPHHHP